MRCSRFCAYLGNRRGATAVEFVLTLPLFLATVFMIVETTLYFFAASNAERAVHSYSRQLVLMQRPVDVATQEERIWTELAALTQPQLFQSMRFAIGTAMPNTDFITPLARNTIGPNIFQNMDKPVFLRVVFQRRSVASILTRPFWLAINAAGAGGLFAPIDVLVVLPFPSRA